MAESEGQAGPEQLFVFAPLGEAMPAPKLTSCQNYIIATDRKDIKHITKHSINDPVYVSFPLQEVIPLCPSHGISMLLTVSPQGGLRDFCHNMRLI